jgi:23S rRNA (uracil-5-)-methyltransferase RumA
MKKGDILDINIEELKLPNKGLGKYEDKKIEVKNTIPGQQVRVRIIKKRKSKIVGRLIEHLSPSEMEIPPVCPVAYECGGCTYQTLPYSTQLKAKTEYVKELLAPLDIEKDLWANTIPSPEVFEYRNKMEFSFGDMVKDGELTLGLHQSGNMYNILNADSCQLVDGDFRALLKKVLDYFISIGSTYFHSRSHQGFLRHLVIRKGKQTGEILINLVTTSQDILDENTFIDLCLNTELTGKITGILHTVNNNVADTVKSDQETILYGKGEFRDRLFDLDFTITPYSFFQTNTLGAEKLYQVVRDFLSHCDNSRIFDLYCGTGTIAQVLSPVASEVTGIELVPEAIEAAKKNAELNRLNNCTFIAGDVMTEVDKLTEKPDIIILDPPRDGIHPKAIHKIIDFQPETFVYVSCKPTSLARDLPFFEYVGYKIKQVQCVDMFPHTPHIETVVLLTR